MLRTSYLCLFSLLLLAVYAEDALESRELSIAATWTNEVSCDCGSFSDECYARATGVALGINSDYQRVIECDRFYNYAPYESECPTEWFDSDYDDYDPPYYAAEGGYVYPPNLDRALKPAAASSSSSSDSSDNTHTTSHSNGKGKGHNGARELNAACLNILSDDIPTPAMCDDDDNDHNSAIFSCSDRLSGGACVKVPDTWRCDPMWYNQAYHAQYPTGVTKYPWETDSVEYSGAGVVSQNAQMKYGNGVDVACHCGCGAPDPDCAVPLAGYKIFCDSLVASQYGESNITEGDASTQYCYNPEGTCRYVPEGWTCPAYRYNQYAAKNRPYRDVSDLDSDGFFSPSVEDPNVDSLDVDIICDCNCGVWDPDCDIVEYVECYPDEIIETDYDTEGFEGCVDLESGTTDRAYCPSPVTTPFSTPSPSPYMVGEEDGEVPDPEEGAEGEGEFSPSPVPPAPTPSFVCKTKPKYLRNYCAKVEKEDGEFTGKCRALPCEWDCSPRWYNEIESLSYGPNKAPDCNCGCGAPDPDCVQEAVRNTQGLDAMPLYGYHKGDTPEGCFRPIKYVKDFCDVNTGAIVTAPDGWSCPSRWWNEATTGSVGPNDKVDCDCNCGLYDPDCTREDKRALGDSSELGLFCNDEGSNYEENLDFSLTCDSRTNKCASVPREWSENCPAKWYNEGEMGKPSRGKAYCDCACGSFADPDCEVQGSKGLSCEPSGAETSNPSTKYCSMEEGYGVCQPVPYDWTCPASYYDEVQSGFHPRGKPFCDCDCGSWDPDCLHDTRTTEGFNSFGLICNSTTGVVSDESRQFCSFDSGKCEAAPAGWYCNGAEYSEATSGTYDRKQGVTCNCGCGVYDPDCDLTSVTDLKCGVGGSLMQNAKGTIFDCPKRGECSFCTLK